MRKIKLDLNDIQVASFATASPETGGGTVLANAETRDCETYAAHICASADDGCATLAHAWTYCDPQCETDPTVCPL